MLPLPEPKLKIVITLVPWEVAYNYWEQPIDPTIKAGLDISSLNLLFRNPTQENKPEIAYVKTCNFCNHIPTLRDFITH